MADPLPIGQGPTYVLVENTCIDGAFAFAGAPVTISAIHASEPTTQPQRFTADIEVVGTWKPDAPTPVALATQSSGPSPDPVKWTVDIDKIKAVWA